MDTLVLLSGKRQELAAKKKAKGLSRHQSPRQFVGSVAFQCIITISYELQRTRLSKWNFNGGRDKTSCFKNNTVLLHRLLADWIFFHHWPIIPWLQRFALPKAIQVGPRQLLITFTIILSQDYFSCHERIQGGCIGCARSRQVSVHHSVR